MKKWFITYFLLLIIGNTYAQYFQSFSNFYMNGQHINPAYAGSREVFSSTLLYRNQWTGLEGSPVTMNFSFHTPLKNLNLAAGFIAFTDKIGVSRFSGLGATYVYRIRMKEGKRNFAMGLKTGITSFKADLSQLSLTEAGDAVFENVKYNITKFDVGFGVYYYSPAYYFSFSIPILGKFGYNSVVSTDSAYSRALSTYIHTGFLINLGSDIQCMPSVAFKSIKNDRQIDLNLSFNILNTLLIGTSIRTAESLVLLLEYQVNTQLRIGYAHDFVISPIHKVTLGTNEFTLRYELIRKYNVYSTRFF